jgi:hypothetical protein
MAKIARGLPLKIVYNAISPPINTDFGHYHNDYAPGTADMLAADRAFTHVNDTK